MRRRLMALAGCSALDVIHILEKQQKEPLGDLDVAVRGLRADAVPAVYTDIAVDFEASGPVNHPSFQRYVTMQGVKRHNWFLNRDAHLYYFYFTKAGVKHLMIVELSSEMVDLVKRPNYMNYGIWQA